MDVNYILNLVWYVLKVLIVGLLGVFSLVLSVVIFVPVILICLMFFIMYILASKLEENL